MDAHALSEAGALVARGDPRAAGAVEALLARWPGHADALLLQGVLAQRRGERDAAVAAFAQAVKADPDHPAALSNLGVALKQAGRAAEAEGPLRRALTLRPDHVATLSNLAGCLIALDRPAEAEAAAREALGRAPDHGEAWTNLAVALDRLGRRDEAEAAGRRALALRPGDMIAAMNLADTLSASGRPAEADALLADVLARVPGHPRASNQAAALREAAGDLDGAISLYRTSIALAGLTHPVGMNLALALLRAGQPAGALEVCEALVAASPSNTAPLAFACAALERLGDARRLDALRAIDRFVTVATVAPPAGCSTLAAFNAALVDELRMHPSLTFEPAGLVTRGGRQSDELATARTPAIAALADAARAALARRHAELAGDDGGHPWLRARPARWSLTLWGTILSPGGAVEAHIHAPNWLSGVYYPQGPAPGWTAGDGDFAIGPLPPALGEGRIAARIAPAAGRLVLFPSFLWHATLPFPGPDTRTSFAFDMVPEGAGRPHRLRR